MLGAERLVSSRRTALANANGSVVLLALLFASAQVFTMLTPETGLMAVLFSAFYVVLLWTTAAARPAAPHLLRSLAVVFGSALVLRFVVLNGIAAPGGSVARRLFTTALEGLTLGGLGLGVSRAGHRVSPRSRRWASSSWDWCCCRTTCAAWELARLASWRPEDSAPSRQLQGDDPATTPKTRAVERGPTGRTTEAARTEGLSSGREGGTSSGAYSPSHANRRVT